MLVVRFRHVFVAAPPATLIARDVDVTFGRQTVLAGVDLTVAPGARVGIVGPNGSGKSTLLKVMSGALRPDRGEVTATPPTATIGYLAQEPERRADETVRAFIARRTGVAGAQRALDASTAALAAGDAGADDAYAAAFDRWLALGAVDVETRAGEQAADLGLPASVLDQTTSPPMTPIALSASPARTSARPKRQLAKLGFNAVALSNAAIDSPCRPMKVSTNPRCS